MLCATRLFTAQKHLAAMQTHAHSMLLCHSRDTPRGTGACCVLLDSSLHKKHLSAIHTHAHSMLLCHSRDTPRGIGACCVLPDSCVRIRRQAGLHNHMPLLCGQVVFPPFRLLACAFVLCVLCVGLTVLCSFRCCAGFWMTSQQAQPGLKPQMLWKLAIYIHWWCSPGHGAWRHTPVVDRLCEYVAHVAASCCFPYGCMLPHGCMLQLLPACSRHYDRLCWCFLCVA
jgi:hypothetical protein